MEGLFIVCLEMLSAVATEAFTFLESLIMNPKESKQSPGVDTGNPGLSPIALFCFFSLLTGMNDFKETFWDFLEYPFL